MALEYLASSGCVVRDWLQISFSMAQVERTDNCGSRRSKPLVDVFYESGVVYC